MSIKLLEHLRDELIQSGAVQNTPEFCRCWLGRSEGYIRTLRHHSTEPSMETLAICSNKLGHYAGRFRTSDIKDHHAWAARFDHLSSFVIRPLRNKLKPFGARRIGCRYDAVIEMGPAPQKFSCAVSLWELLTVSRW